MVQMYIMHMKELSKARAMHDALSDIVFAQRPQYVNLSSPTGQYSREDGTECNVWD